MARRLSLGEIVLGTVVLALVGFVALQVAAPSARRRLSTRGLTARDSASIAAQYRSQLEGRRGSYSTPEWLSDIQLARLEAAAEREVEGRDPIPAVPPDSIAALLSGAENGSYLVGMLAEDRNIVMRWPARAEPIRVWVQPYSSERGFTSDLIAPTRRAFTAWNELGLGAAFAMVDDSTEAEVHVTWSARMPRRDQIGTTFRMTGGAGWIAFAHVVLCTSYDIWAVQNAARHEAGHVLGLGHSSDAADIMAAVTEGKQYVITDADRRTAALVYALPPGPLPATVAVRRHPRTVPRAPRVAARGN